MKNKGFTLTEILAVIVILGILVAIATPVYFSISNNTKKNELQTKINYIKTKALKYAEEESLESSTTIIAATLIANGYISADKYIEDDEYEEIPYIENPVDKKDNLACRIINIDLDEHEYKVSIPGDNNCSLINSDEPTDKLGIRAFKYDGNKMGQELKLKDGKFEWTNTDVILVVNPEYPEIISTRITQRGNTIEVNDNKLTDPYEGRKITQTYSNVIVIDSNSVLKESINVSVQTKTNVNNKTVIVQIDKEESYVKSSKYEGWTKSGKTASVYVGDGYGSGPKGVYVTTSITRSGSETLNNTDENGFVQIANLEEGSYYIWALDNAGNISKSPYELTIVNVDGTNPECRTFGNDKWTTQNVDVGFACYDSDSGCAKDGSSYVKTIKKEMKTTKITIKKTVSFYDNMGNSVNCPKSATANVYIDKSKPTVKLSVKSSKSLYNSTSFTVTVTASDKFSGIKSVCIIPIYNSKDPHKASNCTWIDVEDSRIDSEHNEGPKTYSYTISQNRGNHTDGKKETFKYYAYAKDMVGNISAEKSISYRVYEVCDQTEIYDYGSWGDCDNSCGGKKTRTIYTIDKYFKDYKCANGIEENKDDCNYGCGGGGGTDTGGSCIIGPSWNSTYEIINYGCMCNGVWNGSWGPGDVGGTATC